MLGGRACGIAIEDALVHTGECGGRGGGRDVRV